MPFKSALQILVDSVLIDSSFSMLPKLDPERTRASYVELVANARISVKIVAGEANHQLFDREDFGFAIGRLLFDNPKSTVMFIFHKENEFGAAKRLFQEKNKQLYALKQEFPDRLHIYWSPKRPRQHYAVVDNGALAILEQPSHPRNKPFWATVTSNMTRAKEWSKRFDEYVTYCRELQFAT